MDDWIIMNDWIMMDDWTMIVVRNWEDVNTNWCLEHLEGQWVSLGNYWYFEREEDITVFALRWL